RTAAMPAWRDAGINYIRYSALCAKVVRHCLKPELQREAMKREGSTVKAFLWKDGKPSEVPRKVVQA
ncbi:hypothetical protein BOX15_Mlig008002g1, partial [Macrostomum lignano]